MSFIDLPIDDLDQIVEDQPVPEGEYNLVIRDAKEKQNDNGEIKGILVLCDIVGHDGAATVMHNISLPLPEDDPEKVSNKLKFIKRFVQLFKIPVTGGKLDLSTFIGKQARAKLVQKEWNTAISNQIVLPNAK